MSKNSVGYKDSLKNYNHEIQEEFKRNRKKKYFYKYLHQNFYIKF
jgi:hypothetical protein